MRRNFTRLRFTLGLDLAQSHDWTGLVALQRHEDPSGDPQRSRYDAILIERWRGHSYTAVPGLVQRAEMALRHLAADRVFQQTGRSVTAWDACDVTLAVDATGVGAAVIDILRAAGLVPVPILITGGHAVNRGDRGGFTVPKADLVAVIQLLLEGRRLRIAEELPHAETLVRELTNFRYDYTATGHMRFGAGGDDLVWRGEGQHDDLLLATAVAAWHAERTASRGPIASFEQIAAAWNLPA